MFSKAKLDRKKLCEQDLKYYEKIECWFGSVAGHTSVISELETVWNHFQMMEILIFTYHITFFSFYCIEF